jgi:hypothetical protein
MSDAGTLRKLDVRVLRHNLMGDVTRCHGEVTATRVDGGKGLVEVHVWAENQRGERTADGTATVELPRSDR